MDVNVDSSVWVFYFSIFMTTIRDGGLLGIFCLLCAFQGVDNGIQSSGFTYTTTSPCCLLTPFKVADCTEFGPFHIINTNQFIYQVFTHRFIQHFSVSQLQGAD